MIITRPPWTQQPQQAVSLDTSSSLYNGLVGAFLPGTLQNLVTGGAAAAMTNSGTGGTLGARGKGLLRNGLSTTNFQQWVPPTGMTAGTMLQVRQNTSVTSTDCPWLVGTSVASVDLFPFTDGLIYCGAWSNVRYVSGAAVPVGVSLLKPHVVICVGSTTATTHATYLDGVQVGATGNNTFAYPATMQFGANTGSGTSYSGGTYLTLVWNRILTAAEIAAHRCRRLLIRM